MPGSESANHLALKRSAALWAQGQGYGMVAPEVMLPNCRYRADVAAYRPDRRSGGILAVGETAVFECKQARSDFLKDSRSASVTTQRLAELSARRATLESLLGVHFPNLRKGETLFPEYDVYDFDQLSHKGYGEVMREIRILQKRLYEKTKFERLVNWRCANAFYLVVTPGILAEHEVPAAWGLLELKEEHCQDSDNQSGANLTLLRKPTVIQCADSARLELLQRLAAHGTKELNRQLGVDFEQVQEAARACVR
ncbi:MAG: hypothetical protein ACI9R3_000760 [Verrucomicrobiales bacterium]|jgi:hypothetical protein